MIDITYTRDRDLYYPISFKNIYSMTNSISRHDRDNFQTMIVIKNNDEAMNLQQPSITNTNIFNNHTIFLNDGNSGVFIIVLGV